MRLPPSGAFTQWQAKRERNLGGWLVGRRLGATGSTQTKRMHIPISYCLDGLCTVQLELKGLFFCGAPQIKPGTSGQQAQTGLPLVGRPANPLIPCTGRTDCNRDAPRRVRCSAWLGRRFVMLFPPSLLCLSTTRTNAHYCLCGAPLAVDNLHDTASMKRTPRIGKPRSLRLVEDI